MNRNDAKKKGCGGINFPLFALAVAAICGTILFAGTARAEERTVPFHPGEKLTFEARWGVIPAGMAVLEILPMKTVGGVKAYHFVMTARTYPFIDVFYKVRDRIESYTDSGMTRSLLFKTQKRGKRKKDVVVAFDWERKEATYSKSGKRRKPVSVIQGSLDPLSVFYAFRLHDLSKEEEILRPVTDGKKCIMGKAKVIRRETVSLPNGSYDTYLVEPELEHIGGVFKKSPNARLRIWVTADELKMPVRVESKVVVGSFVADLISVEGIGEDQGRPGKGPAVSADRIKESSK
jgi:uncharacterized protein DUF3108